MDFARKQLEKYGWKDGKGLGKYENGIAEALKPKLKRSVTGIGHDAASEFNEHWWETLYDKAANNIKVKDKNGKTKSIKQGDNEFQITNSMWRLKKTIKKDPNQPNNITNTEYHDIFVRKAILTGDGAKTEDFDDKNDSSSDVDDNNKDVFKMTDEQLFAACGGRTAHKGARHGLKALGKLARIEEQEAKMLSMSKYEGYSKAKKDRNTIINVNTEIKEKKKYIETTPEEISIVNELIIQKNNDNEATETIKIKKKRKKTDYTDSIPEEISVVNELVIQNKKNNDIVVTELKTESVKLKSKRKKREYITQPEETINVNETVNENKNKYDVYMVTEKKQKKKEYIDTKPEEIMNVEEVVIQDNNNEMILSSKVEEINNDNVVTGLNTETIKIKKKRKKNKYANEIKEENTQEISTNNNGESEVTITAENIKVKRKREVEDNKNEKKK